MTTFKVKGGLKLKGDIHPQGAKNEALQVLCAVLLTSEEVVMENVPDIRDVNILINLLKDLNVRVEKKNHLPAIYFNQIMLMLITSRARIIKKKVVL
jgi:UDP-N-acetylglucosamine enolpyruvyl transferase